MKNFLTILLGITCITVLILGQFHWKQKIEAAPKGVPVKTDIQKMMAKTESNKSDEGKSNNNKTDLLRFTNNWPVNSADRFKQTLSEGRKFKILFVGSPAIGSETEGTYPIVKQKMIETFGEQNIQISLHTFNSTSTQFISSNKISELTKEGADLIILEPFILLNNGNVSMENTLNNVSKIMDEIIKKKPETGFILQPSYPLYKAKIYPSQVQGLKSYAGVKKITYLDHWSAWPDANTEDFKAYLKPDQSAPSEKGNQVWSEYLIKFLISQ